MKVFRHTNTGIIVMILMSMVVIGCEDDVLILHPLVLPKPPHQIGTWDLVGLNGESDITSILIIPNQPWKIFVGTMSDFSSGTQGKILKSYDWGAVWKTVLDSVDVRNIVIDPKTDSVLYASLGPGNGAKPGIVKSIDEGSCWVRTDSGLPFTNELAPGAIAVDPSKSGVVYVGITGLFGGGMIKSTNAGKSWFILPPEYSGVNPLGWGIAAIGLDPKNTDELYVGASGKGNILKSYDGGITFAPVYQDTQGLPEALVVNPFRTNAIYLGSSSGPILYSTDHGITWNVKLSQIFSGAQNIIVAGDSVLLVGERASGGGGVFRSNDDGMSWEYVGFMIDSVSVQVQTMEIDRQNGFLYAANDFPGGGLYRYKIHY